MTLRKFLLLDALVGFTALTAWCLFEVGVSGLLETVTWNAATITLTVDLVIALTLVLAWLVRDARRHGRNAAPYVVLTLLTGSVGPLLYLVLGEER